jgi:hypothetical protein
MVLLLLFADYLITIRCQTQIPHNMFNLNHRQTINYDTKLIRLIVK